MLTIKLTIKLENKLMFMLTFKPTIKLTELQWTINLSGNQVDNQAYIQVDEAITVKVSEGYLVSYTED